MKKVFIVSAKRTAIGSFLGTLKDVHPAQLGGPVIASILSDTGIDPANIDEVIIGNILSAGLRQGIARQVSVAGGIPVSVPAYAVNHVCCSGMKAVMNAVDGIKSGRIHMAIAGGVESMSGAPFITPGKVRQGVKLGNITSLDHIVFDSLTDAFNNEHMGITAENIAEAQGITREAQDAYAYGSQQKAIAAVDAGYFKSEIVPLHVKAGRNEIIFDTDEYPNRGTNIDKLAGLRPAFKKDGTVTAGNASGINDGASMTLIAGEDAVKKYNLTPLAEIISVGQAGIDPAIMGLGPVPAIKNALDAADINIGEIDLFELNEAFAAQAIGVHNGLVEMGISAEVLESRANITGGAIALGHPIGASGNRIITTLVHNLMRAGKTYGIASLCAGGGMGTAVLLKNCQ